MVEKLLNNTTTYGKIRASHEGLLHSSTLMKMNVYIENTHFQYDNHRAWVICITTFRY